MQLEEPTQLHKPIVAMLSYFLTAWRKAGGKGLVLASGYKVRIRDDQAFMPDVQYFKPGHVVPEHGLSEGGPDLAIEIISPSSARFDRVEKLNRGVMAHRALHRYVLGPTQHFVLEDALCGDALFRPTTFSALEISLTELWILPK